MEHAYYTSEDLLSCGHFPTAEAPEVWWVRIPAKAWKTEEAANEFCSGGTYCRGCAALAEEIGWPVDLIPSGEQILAWLDWESQGIGTN